MPSAESPRDNKDLHEATRISEFIKQSAVEAGFDLAAIAPVLDFPELSYFPDWIAAGHAGEMKYLESRDDAGNLRRASLKTAFPWARSVIVCAMNYNTSAILAKDGFPATLGAAKIITTPCSVDCAKWK